jgi:hypothetical protein
MLSAEIYVKKGTNSDATEFNYDMAFLGQVETILSPRLSSSLREGYSVAIY